MTDLISREAAVKVCAARADEARKLPMIDGYREIAEAEACADAIRSLPAAPGVVVPVGTLLAVRDALIKKDYDEAYHRLYEAAAESNFGLLKPWAAWEAYETGRRLPS